MHLRRPRASARPVRMRRSSRIMRRKSDVGWRIDRATRQAGCRLKGKTMRASTIVRIGASAAVILALSASVQAYQDDDNDNGDGDRRSTWELNTSLTFQRYFEPFARVSSARA